MKCYNCGKKLNKNEEICGGCGIFTDIFFCKSAPEKNVGDESKLKDTEVNKVSKKG